MNIYRMIVHHTDRAAAMRWIKANRRIAIGWGEVGDIARYDSVEQIKAAIKDKYRKPDYPQNSGNGGPSLWDFAHSIEIGDLILLSGAKGRELVVEVVGDYEFVPGASPLYGEYNHQRAIEMTQYDGDKLWRAAGGLEAGASVYRTLVRCQNAVDGDRLASLTA